MDLQQLLAAAQQMQDQLVTAQRELADATIEGTAGSGLVKAVVNGEGKLVDLTISAAAIDPADAAETAETVADLVLAAVRDAYRKAEELQQEKMGPLAAGLGGGPDPGGIPGLSDFFSGGAAALGGGPGQPGQGTQPPQPGQGTQPGGPEQPGDQPGPAGGRPGQPGP
jgi:DNA-binding YbaB/EbfC family protein